MLDTTPGLSQQDLAWTLGLARATISELVTILVDRGWAQRTPDDNDRRVQRLQLTDTGHDMAASINTSRHALLHRVLHELDPADRTTAIHIIGRLVDAAARARATTDDDTDTTDTTDTTQRVS